MSKWMKRAAIAVPILALAAVFGAPYMSAEPLKSRIHRDLEHALGRKVEINGEARFQMYPSPGVSLSRVVIHELPEFGVEPIAYLDYPESSLDVSLSVIALLRGRVEVSGVRLVAPSLNMAKLADGGWNFQRLLNPNRTPSSGAFELTGIEVQRARLNIKFADRKSVFYLTDTDLTVEADTVNPDRFSVTIEGDPARSDRITSSFGRLTGRGLLTRAKAPGEESQIDLSLAIERTPIAEIMTAFAGRSIGLGGFATSQAKLKGPLSAIAVDGRVELQEAERFGWLFSRAANRSLQWKGVLDVPGQEFRLETPKDLPVSLRARAFDLLSNPRWAALLDVHGAPLDSLRALAADVSISLPTETPAEGSLSGVLGFSAAHGTKGQVELTDAVLPIPDLPNAHIDSARVLVDNRRFHVPEATLRFSEQESVTVETRVDAATGERDVRVETSGLDVDRSRKALGFLGSNEPIPFLSNCTQGAWSGTLRSSKDASGALQWTGDLQVRQAIFRADGLADPVRLESAQLALRGPVVLLRRMDVSAGKLKAMGDADFDPRRKRALRVSLTLPTLAAADLEHLFMPSLRREAGLLARLRRPPAMPDWLRQRRLDGSLTIGQFTAGDNFKTGKVTAQFAWEGGLIKLTNVAAAAVFGGSASGEAEIDVTSGTPSFKGIADVRNASWQEGGRIDTQAEWQASGTGVGLLASFTAKGTFTGRGMTIAPESVWETASGSFQWTAGRLQISALEAAMGGESWQGQGNAGPDGRLAFELTSPQHQKQVRLASRLW